MFVCSFVESGNRLDGNYIQWKSYKEDQNIEKLFPVDHYNCIILQTNDDGIIYLDLNLHAKFFMWEKAYEHLWTGPELIIEFNEIGQEKYGTYRSKDFEIINSYEVYIVNYEYDALIENIFK